MPRAGIVGVRRARGRGCWRRSSRYMVMSRAPTGTLTPSTSAITLHEPAGERDAAGRDAEQDEVLGALVALEDLVRDRGAGPGRRHRRSSPPSRRRRWGPTRRGEPAVGATESGRVTAPDLLPRLTGRVVKGCRSRARQSLPCGPRGPARWSTGQTRVGLISARRASRPLTKRRRVVGRQRRGQRRPPRRSPPRRATSSTQSSSKTPMPQERAVDGGHPVERPALGVRREQLVDPVRGARRRPRPARRCTRCTGGSVAGRPARSASSVDGVDAAQLGLEQDVERALARLACGRPSGQAQSSTRPR